MNIVCFEFSIYSQLLIATNRNNNIKTAKYKYKYLY